jgi:hypothetical protein
MRMIQAHISVLALALALNCAAWDGAAAAELRIVGVKADHWCVTFRYGKPNFPGNPPWGQKQSMEEVAEGF